MPRARLPPNQPRLVVPREDAETKISHQIEKANQIRALPINSWEALEEAEGERSKWKSYSGELLKRLFDTPSFEQELNDAIGFVVSGGPRDLRYEAKEFLRDMDRDIAKLESIRERLELIPEPVSAATEGEVSVKGSRLGGKSIFVVHGHDEAAKQSVARLLERLTLRALILHEQPNAGRTLIEKFEDYSDVRFAVIVLTPDDVGYPNGREAEAKSRARQNVIFELGFFIGKLGRKRVCAIYKEGVEIPSDYIGVLYIPMDAAGAWQLRLAKELKHAGIEVDPNKLLED